MTDEEKHLARLIGLKTTRLVIQAPGLDGYSCGAVAVEHWDGDDYSRFRVATGSDGDLEMAARVCANWMYERGLGRLLAKGDPDAD